MSSRHRHKTRRLIDVTLECVAAGTISRELAAQELAKSGVPLTVIGRVLGTMENKPASAAAGTTMQRHSEPEHPSALPA